MEIEKKVWPEYFQAIVEGKKKYELRMADWKCKEGDILILKEWDPETKKLTGRQLKKTITYVGIFKIDQLFWPKEEIERHGLMILSLE